MPVDDIAELLARWPDPAGAAVAVTSPTETLALGGDTTAVSRIASISKVFVGLTATVAVEEGTLTLDDPVGPGESTARHLLAHASGLAFDEHTSISDVGRRRIYSNSGIEVFATYLSACAEMPYDTYQHGAVFEPLQMAATELRGSPAHGVWSCIDDLILFARELLAPTLVARVTLAEATRTQFPDLGGVLPGWGTFDPNPWGLGLEIRGSKSPHWTAPSNSPDTFGHFGGTGTYLWVDPQRQLAAVAVSGTEFGPWANTAWPETNAAILERYGDSYVAPM